ncbi:substrate-binding domain-containing protein [Nocardia grenadensis]|uniref:substrate-binding domain-containing protein n=1 Tax=Nocardia grenadensis TaxID=931537 RepID=UPI0009FD58AE|nr:substrate-binding domain-containing protein [Nocardia grenadensis]
MAARPTGDRPDAALCVNDLLAIGVLQALTLRGIEIPGDVALLGYDDIDFAPAGVPLTCIRRTRADIVSVAVDLLVAAADDGGSQPEHVCFRPYPFERASTAA